MTDDTDNTYPILRSVTRLDPISGSVGLNVTNSYIPPMDGSHDELREFDQWISDRVAEILVESFFGYPWKVVADSRQGVVYFQIPELMGGTLHYVIRLAQYSDLTKNLIRRCGGELLERMGLPRGKIDQAAFAKAMQNRHLFDFADVAGGKRR